MENYNYNGSTEYEKAIRFLETGCNCGCSKKIPREKFTELHEAFQALARPEQDIFVKKKCVLIRDHFTTEIAIRPFVTKYVRNWSHALRERQKPSGNEWYNTACSW